MKRFRDIIQDIKAPSTSDLWINNGELKSGCFITIKENSPGKYLVDYIEV